MNTIETLAEMNLTPERYEELLKDCSDKTTRTSDLDWSEISDKYSLGFHGDTCRKASQTILGGAFVAAYFKEKYARGNNFDDDAYIKELQLTKRELEKERKKIQTEKLEYAKFLREDARDELITEKICDAIANLPELIIPDKNSVSHDNKDYLLCFGDCHYGIEFSIKDFYGNVINEYSPEIFEQRMWYLLDQVVDIIEKEGIDTLNVWELGDGLQGIIRLNSQLMKLRYGIIDSSMLYANFLANWLNELSKYVNIKFQMVVDSNHNQLRICNAPKNAFVEENMSKSMLVFIKERLKDNPNIIFIDNPTGMNYGLMSTYATLGIHGEVKNLANAIDGFTRAYQAPINYLIGAHCHHSNGKETGVKSEVISIRSIIGVDPYGMSLNATSDAGASLLTFDNIGGLIREDKIKLN